MSNKSNNKSHEPSILSNLVLKFDNNNNNTTDFNNKDKSKQDDLNRLGFERISNKINNSFNEKQSMDNSNNEQNDNLVNSLIINTIKNKFEKNLNDLNFLKTVGFMRIRFKDVFEGLLKTNRIEDYDPAQNYQKIRETYSINRRFTDFKFRACDESVYYSDTFKSWLESQNRKKYRGEIIWKRAKDLHSNSQFAIDDNNPERLLDPNQINESNYRNYFHTTDLDQGMLGNCWFISAATGIVQNYSLFKRIVPADNYFDDKNYTGAFHFRFWVFGSWKDVVIDDYLPVDSYNRLIFCKNRDTSNEFWCALLEKAYAKLCLSYEAMEGGFTSDALIDMSGGIEEVYNLISLRKSLSSYRVAKPSDLPTLDHKSFWEILTTARKKHSVIGCNIELTDASLKDVKLANGLVEGHAYIITKIAELELNGKETRLVRVYNPWGNEVEWNGEWSDRSSIWRRVDSETKEILELKIESDGEFWMSYEDWLRNFDNCQICNLTPESIIDDLSESDWQNARILSNLFSMWQSQIFHGKWVRGITAGGRGQDNENKYWTNPQFTFLINENDLINNENCWVIIGLMQKYTRQKRVQLNVESAEEYIQYRLYKARDADRFHECISNNVNFNAHDLERINSSGSYTNKREVTARFALKAGAYVIIPSCYDEDVEGEFLIRIFTEKPLSKKSLSSINNDYQSLNRRNDKEVITKQIGSLSLGGEYAFNKFIGIASDFAKSATNNKDAFRKKRYESIESDEDDDYYSKPQISCNPS